MIEKKAGALRKNDVIPLTVTGYSAEGSGVGHYDGMAVFVAGAAAGDELDVLLIKTKKTYAVGKIQRIRKASADRTEAACPAFPRCGGCVFRHIAYDAELRLKEQRVRDALQRLGHLEVPVLPITASPAVTGYRNKAQYPVEMENGRLKTGFYAAYSHRVVDSRSCALQPPEFSGILRVFARFVERYKISAYDETEKKGLLRHIYIRKAFATGEIMVCAVINGARLFKTDALVDALVKENEHIVTVCVNHNTEDTNVILGETTETVYGRGYIEDILCGLRFRISPQSFYQVNSRQAENLYGKAADYAKRGARGTLLDLYCGAGTIGLTMAKDFDTVIGAEIVPSAIADAQTNAKLNGITNAEFLCGDAAQAALTLENRGVRPDCVVVDPPRKGCDTGLLQTIVRLAPTRIVYVSCDPATLARDCALLAENGYRVAEAAPYDMFPRCAHVETVALLLKND